MKKKIVILYILILSVVANAQTNDGKVTLDWQNAPTPQFTFDLDRSTILQVLENPNTEISSLYSRLDNLHLRSYLRQGLNYQQMLRHYHNTLTTRNWRSFQKGDKLHLYTQRKNEFVVGIFLIVSSGIEVIVINMTGKIPPNEVGKILRNLDELGIDISELKNLGRLPDSAVALLDENETTTDPIKLENPKQTEEFSNSILTSWYYDRKPIDDFIIQNARDDEVTNIYRFLENGSGDLINVLPMLYKTLGSRRTVTIRTSEEGSKNVAILTVKERKRRKSISVLRSITINQTGTGRKIKSSTANLEIDEFFPNVATRFKASDAPIHEIRIIGNQRISEQDIRASLNNGPNNIERALKTLYKVMPYFSEIKLDVREISQRRIATITFTERLLSSNLYLGLRPPVSTGFNRVNEWEIGTGFQIGKPTELVPVWMWNVGDSLDTRTYNLYGRISRTTGNPKYHYRFGGRINWGEPYIWSIRLTGQLHRQTAIVAPYLFPNYNQGNAVSQRILGFPDLANYYLKQGSEISLSWSPILPTHSFNFTMTDESHQSLDKSSDWSLLQWVAKDLKSRSNPGITIGRIRSLTFKYTFSTQADYLGWHNTLLIENSNNAFGSDFDFTRAQLHLRYAFPFANHFFKTRLLLGLSDSSLPIQRQFAISGHDGLRGYPLYVPANESEEKDDPKPWYGYSQYAFMGDNGFLLNVEFHYRLSNLYNRTFFRNMFLVLFLDEGQVWNTSDDIFTFDPKADIGIGLQFHEADIFRFNVAKTLDSWQGYQISFGWMHSF